MIKMGTTDRGPLHDRRWMLVDSNGQFITQRERADLVHFTTQMNDGSITVGHRDTSSIELPLQIAKGSEAKVKVWSSKVKALVGDTAWNQWFSGILGMDTRLVFMPDSSERTVNWLYAKRRALNSFSDGYPYLVIGQSSLDDLNGRLETPVPMDRFRPNIVFEGGPAFGEDEWKDVQLGSATFRRVKPCDRCVIISTDQETGERGKEPTKTLSMYRKSGNNVQFGQNLICLKQGTIEVGDEIQST